MIVNPGVIGIDISKHHLDLFDPAHGAERVVNSCGQSALLATRFAEAGAFVLFEATGCYDQALRRALTIAGVPFARVNPRQARDFAKAAGFLAKTDAVDARMLAAMAQCLRPPRQDPLDPERERLARLIKRRAQLVAMRQQERTRRSECHDSEIADSLEHHLAWLDATLGEIDRAIQQLIAGSPELRRQHRLLRSAPGIGPVVAAVLLALLPELGCRSPKTIAALVGLAPFNVDSGRFRGQRRIRGGRKAVRDALYMAALTAARSNSRFQRFYRNLLDAGKPPKRALLALARKLLVALNAILRDQTAFQP
jgi:transposase